MPSDPSTPEDDESRNPDGTFKPGHKVTGGGWNAHTFSLRQLIAKTLKRDPNLAQLVVDNLIESAGVRKDPASLGFIRELLKQTDGNPVTPVEVVAETTETIILEDRSQEDPDGTSDA